MKKYFTLFSFMAILAFTLAACGGGGGSAASPSSNKVTAFTSWAVSKTSVNSGDSITVSWTVDAAALGLTSYDLHTQIVDASLDPTFTPTGAQVAASTVFTISCNPAGSQTIDMGGTQVAVQSCSSSGSATCTYTAYANGEGGTIAKGAWNCVTSGGVPFYSFGTDTYSGTPLMPALKGAVPYGRTSFFIRSWVMGAGADPLYDWKSQALTIN